MCRVRGGSRIGLLQKAANSLQEAENRRKSFCAQLPAVTTPPPSPAYGDFTVHEQRPQAVSLVTFRVLATQVKADLVGDLLAISQYLNDQTIAANLCPYIFMADSIAARMGSANPPVFIP